jgi:outer membrane receptor protein involved in Fe transport
VFERSADPIIDWILGDDGVWRATNAGRVETRGGEVAFLVPTLGPALWQRIGAVVLDSTIDVDPKRSAYALAHPRFEAVWSGAVVLAETWRGGWTARFRDPSDGGSWALVDLSLECDLSRSMVITAEVSNLLDREVTELHGVPLPGRWATVTLAWRSDRPGS